MAIKDIYINKNIDGSFTASSIIEGYRVSKRYYGYTKREVVLNFRRLYEIRSM